MGLDNSNYQVIAGLRFYTFDSESTGFNIRITQQVVKGDTWNLCDNVGDIIVYNAKASNVNHQYDIYFWGNSTDTILRNAVNYNETTDQLVFRNNVANPTEFADVW